MKILPQKIVVRNETVYIPVNSNRFTGLNCLITGGSGSLGKAIAERLIFEGASVILASRNIGKLEHTVEELKRRELQCDYVSMDVTSSASIEHAVLEVGAKYHHIDILINNAGFSARTEKQPLHCQKIETIDSILTTNLRGAVLVSHFVIPFMAGTKCGRIIHIASIVATGGKVFHAEYGAAKAGLLGLTRSLALELGPQGITVNCVSPGLVPRDDASPEKLLSFSKTNVLGRVETPQDIANACAFLAAPEAAFITGQNLIVDGGRSLGLRGD